MMLIVNKKTNYYKVHTLVYGDILRLLATIGVVILHTVAPKVSSIGLISLTDWWIYNIIDSAFRWTVPIFFILSGALLLDPNKTEHLSEFLRKRFFRVGIPMLFWCFFYLIWEFTWLNIKWPSSLVKHLLLGNPYYHLYFLFAITELYLLTPVLLIIIKHSTMKQYIVLTIAIFIATSFDSLVRRIVGYEYSAILKFVPFLGYYCAGYLLKQTIISNRNVWKFGILVLLSMGGTALGTYFLINKFQMHTALYFYDYLSPTVIIMSLSGFLIISNRSGKNLFAKAIQHSRTKELASYTFGVYLVHPIVLDLLFAYENRVGEFATNTWLRILLVSVSTLLVSFAITMSISRIPYIRCIVK